MPQYVFGAGSMVLTPILDASGATIANPTPVKVFDMQEVSIDMGADLKKLYGQNSFPIAVGVGKRDLSIKLKNARVLGRLWNSLFFGQTLTNGLTAASMDEAKTIPATPFQVTVTPPSSGTFSADLGVVDVSTGRPFTKVASAPAAGQYSVNGTGVYNFAAADTTKAVSISYSYTATVAGAVRQSVQNQPMGYAPTFKADLSVAYHGSLAFLSFPMCVSGKLGMNLKNEDFMTPEFEFGAFDNGSGVVMTWSVSEG